VSVPQIYKDYLDTAQDLLCKLTTFIEPLRKDTIPAISLL